MTRRYASPDDFKRSLEVQDGVRNPKLWAWGTA